MIFLVIDKAQAAKHVQIIIFIFSYANKKDLKESYQSIKNVIFVIELNKIQTASFEKNLCSEDLFLWPKWIHIDWMLKAKRNLFKANYFLSLLFLFTFSHNLTHSQEDLQPLLNHFLWAPILLDDGKLGSDCDWLSWQ